MARVMFVGLSVREVRRWEKVFQRVGVGVEVIASLDSAMERIPADPPSLVITEHPDEPSTLRSLQAVLSASAPATPFLVKLPETDLEMAMEAMRAGAYDCLAPPYDRFQVLAASKRAAGSRGRTLFVAKVRKPKSRSPKIALALFLLVAGATGFHSTWNGPPTPTLNLASATLSGLSWEGRSLWVADWYEATVSRYVVRKGLRFKDRTLVPAEVYRLKDTQPILVCNTAEAIVTIGFDLQMRVHQRSLGLPTLQSAAAPGSSPTGLAFDGKHIWTTDGDTGLLYEHGDDLAVLRTIKSLVPKPSGLAWDHDGFWVIGGMPLRAARLERYGTSWVWRGPFKIKGLLPDGVVPSGVAVGFDRVWAVAGGDPRATSRSIPSIEDSLVGWRRTR